MCSIRYTRAPFDSQCCHTAESRRARGGKTKPSRDGLLKTRPFLPSGHAGVLMRPNVEPQEHTPPRSTSHARRHMPQARTSAHTASPEVSNRGKRKQTDSSSRSHAARPAAAHTPSRFQQTRCSTGQPARARGARACGRTGGPGARHSGRKKPNFDVLAHPSGVWSRHDDSADRSQYPICLTVRI